MRVGCALAVCECLAGSAPLRPVPQTRLRHTAGEPWGAVQCSCGPNWSCMHLPTLQEKGWDVDQTIEKLLKNGTRISAEAHEIVRIPGLLTDADMIGARGLGWRGVGEWGAVSCWPPAGRHAASPAGQVRNALYSGPPAVQCCTAPATALHPWHLQVTLCGRMTAPPAAGGPPRSWTRSTCPRVRIFCLTSHRGCWVEAGSVCKASGTKPSTRTAWQLFPLAPRR